jgi:hypothetical protein
LQYQHWIRHVSLSNTSNVDIGDVTAIKTETF